MPGTEEIGVGDGHVQSQDMWQEWSLMTSVA